MTIKTAKPKLAQGISRRTTLNMVFVKDIHVEENWNPRIDFGAIEEIVASIRSNGFYSFKPLLVKRRMDLGGDGFYIIDGERRFRAVLEFNRLAKKAGTEEITDLPVVIDSNRSEVDRLTSMYVANGGKNFLPLEEAIAFDRMLKQSEDVTVDKISAMIGRSTDYIRGRLMLLNASEEVKDAMKSGDIGVTAAIGIVQESKGDKEVQRRVVTQAKSSPEAKREVTNRVQRIIPMQSASKVRDKMTQLATGTTDEQHAAISRLIQNDDAVALAYAMGVSAALEWVLKQREDIHN